MASLNSSAIRTVSKTAQKKSLGNILKKKKKQSINRKGVPKAVLDNPFSLDWPPLDYKDYIEIQELLRASLHGFNFKNSKASFATYSHLKKKERISFLEKHRKENSDTNLQSYFVVGFNCVMRHLEKKEIACIFVNIETKPDFCERLFIPLCSALSIPLVPLKGLVDIVSSKETLGIQKCRALGLTLAAACSNSPFWQLYCSSCHAFGIEPSESAIPDSQKKHITLKDYSDKFSSKQLSKNEETLTKEQITALHLKREDKIVRIFRPQLSSKQEAISESFIAFSKDCEEPQKSNHRKKKRKLQKSKIDTSHLLSEDMFVIDEDPSTEIEIQDLTKANPPSKVSKRTASYIPAKVKRIKKNPNRKS